MDMRLLVLGGTGMMGHMACRIFAEHHDVLTTCRSSLKEYPQWQEIFARSHVYEKIDCRDHERVEWLFEECRPDVVLNCVGAVKQLKESKDPLVSIPVNALLPHELAKLCEGHGCKLIQLSTDCVFSGGRGNYKEEDIPDPVDLYDRTKLLGEVDYGGNLTIRSSIIGRQLRGNTGLIEWFLSQNGKSIQGYKEVVFSGLTTKALCRVILEILEKFPGLQGLYHVASQPISKFDLLAGLNERLKLGIQITPYSAIRCDRSLNASLFLEMTTIKIPSWDEMLDELAEDVVNYEKWRK